MKPFLSIDIPTYGVCVLVALYISFTLITFRQKKYEYGNRLMLFTSAIVLVGMYVGAKILYLITQIPHVATGQHSFVESVSILFGGQVMYGGLIGALLATLLCAKFFELDKKKLFSFLAPIFPAFHGIGRIGCFLGGCCYGVPWKYGFAMAETPDIVRFPVQLVEAGFEITLSIVLLIIEHKKGVRNNNMLIYLGVYAVGRFVLEFFRGDTIRGLWLWGISTSQIVAILFVVFIIGYCVVRKSKKRG